jgi:putative ABC transport system permease protein
LFNAGLVTSVTRTSAPLTKRFSDTWGIRWPGKAANDKTDFDRYSEDEDLVRTAGLKLIKGRDMDPESYPTDSTAMLLNESAARAMGFKDAVGQIVTDQDIKFHVIGVFKDFILTSPYEPTRPMVIEAPRSLSLNVINMKLRAGNSTARSLELLGQLFKKYNPEYPFECHFVDEEYAQKFADTERTATFTGLFAGLTIFISCLGLFGLAAYMAQNRIKEIGVRKVLGASVFRITALLSGEFLTLVIIAMVIASPIAWYAMHHWLESFSYRITIEWWVFVMVGLLSVIISLLTVSYQAIRAAIANPIKSLRTE